MILLQYYPFFVGVLVQEATIIINEPVSEKARWGLRGQLRDAGALFGD
jgi:hypothetical protein